MRRVSELRPSAANDVDPLHLLAVTKKQSPYKLARVKQRVRLARRRLTLADVVELCKRRKIVRPQSERLRHALVRVWPADDVDRMHHRPMHRLVEGRLWAAGKDVVVGLRPAQPEHPPERSHQLVLQLHLLLRRGAGAPTIKHKNGVLDKPRRNNRIDAFGDAVLQAAGGIARTITQKQIGHRTVAVVDDGDLLGNIVAALNVSRKDKPGRAQKRIRSADVFIECPASREHQARCGNVPDVSCRGNQSIGRSVVHAGAQIPRIGKVERLIGIPDHRNSSRGEVRLPSDPPRSSSP